MYQECVPQSTVNLLFATRQLVCGTASRMIFAKSKILRSSRGWSAHGAAHRANVQCAKVNLFLFCFCLYNFLPQFAFYLLCFALLNFYFAFISSLLCFNVNWNVFLTNIRHVFLGAQRDHLSEMVLLSTHNICFSHQY